MSSRKPNFMDLSQQSIAKLREMVESGPQQIVILSHTNPDGEALGSSLAWAKALRALGHTVTCVVPNRFPYYLDWMTDVKSIVVYKCDEQGVAAKAVEKADMIFCLDFHTLSRLDAPLSELIASNTKAKRVLIDHHLNPAESFDVMFSHPEASSTSFLVYRLIEELWGAESVTKEQAEVLYVGMMTDTGNFSFSSLTPDLYRS